MERSYVVPLRREWLKVPAYKRAKKAVTALKEFFVKHMKSEDIHISKEINLMIWTNGIKRPPHKIKVKALKNDEGKVIVQLPDKQFPDLTKKVKEEQGMVGKTLEKLTGKKKGESKESKTASKEEKKEAPKAEKKEPETKEESKEEKKVEEKKEPAKEEQPEKKPEPVKEEPTVEEKPKEEVKEAPEPKAEHKEEKKPEEKAPEKKE